MLDPLAKSFHAGRPLTELRHGTDDHPRVVSFERLALTGIRIGASTARARIQTITHHFPLKARGLCLSCMKVHKCGPGRSNMPSAARERHSSIEVSAFQRH